MVKAFGEKYELDLMPIVINGKRLEIYGVSNWDIFVERLGRDGEAYIKKFPFWTGTVKRSLLKNPMDINSKRSFLTRYTTQNDP